MEEGDLDFSNPDGFSDSIFDDLLKDTHGCTHTHICTPPASTDLPHTHTCYHVHHNVLSHQSNEETVDSSDKSQPRKAIGNRVAVKKYREKRKARAASLEEEVAHLRLVNQQLTKRLQGQAALEAEVARLRCLLVDIRGRIEGEIGAFPYQKPSGMLNRSFVNGGGGAQILNSCADLVCHDGVLGNGQGCVPCDVGNVQCMGSSSNGSKEEFVCGGGNGMGVGCLGNADMKNYVDDEAC